jgi:hypothetical protein
MYVINLFLQVGVLWFLITFYSRSTNSSSTLRETWIVIIGMIIVGFFSRLLLGGLLGPFTGILSLIALYFLVEKICDLSRKSTIKICVFYVVIMILFGIVGSILAMPV